MFIDATKTSYYAGTFLRKARKEKNLTGKQLAKLMLVSQPQISRYETGKTSLTIDQLSHFLILLDKTWGELLIFIQEESDRDLEQDKSYSDNNIHSLSKYLTDSLLK